MKNSNADIIINKQSISPGEKKILYLPMPKLYDSTPLSMPVHVIRGKEPGPTLGITAAIHGDEVNGIEVVRRILKKPVIKKLKGTLIAIPIVNVYGFLYQNRYLMDRRDLNRSFPGSPKGSLAARLAYLITDEILSKTTHIIDLHAGSLHRTNLPQIRTNTDIPSTLKLAKAFNAPVILHAALKDGSIRQYANEKSIPFILYEAGESLRFDELSIRSGVSGILRVMDELGMITIRKSSKLVSSAVARSSFWIRSPNSGIFRVFKSLGKKVKKGELIAKIGNPTTTEEHELVSPVSGIIIGKSNVPMVHEGAALFNVACFEELKHVADKIEQLQEIYNDPYEYQDL